MIVLNVKLRHNDTLIELECFYAAEKLGLALNRKVDVDLLQKDKMNLVIL